MAEPMPLEVLDRSDYADKRLYVFAGETGIWRRLSVAAGKSAEGVKAGRNDEFFRRHYVRDGALELQLLAALDSPKEEAGKNSP